MTGAILEVCSTEELRALLPRRARRHVRQVTLALPGIPDHTARSAERLMARALRSCGCETGAITLVIGLLVTAPRATSALREHQLGVGLGATFAGFLLACAAVGKILGLVWADWSFRRIVRAVVAQARLDESTRADPVQAPFG